MKLLKCQQCLALSIFLSSQHYEGLSQEDCKFEPTMGSFAIQGDPVSKFTSQHDGRCLKVQHLGGKEDLMFEAHNFQLNAKTLVLESPVLGKNLFPNTNLLLLPFGLKCFNTLPPFLSDVNSIAPLALFCGILSLPGFQLRDSSSYSSFFSSPFPGLSSVSHSTLELPQSLIRTFYIQQSGVLPFRVFPLLICSLEGRKRQPFPLHHCISMVQCIDSYIIEFL